MLTLLLLCVLCDDADALRAKAAWAWAESAVERKSEPPKRAPQPPRQEPRPPKPQMERPRPAAPAVHNFGGQMVHDHQCPKCGTRWTHPDSMSGNYAAHQCPKCGTLQWQQVPGSRRLAPAQPQPAQRRPCPT